MALQKKYSDGGDLTEICYRPSRLFLSGGVMFWGAGAVMCLWGLLFIPRELVPIPLVHEVSFVDRLINYLPQLYIYSATLISGTVLVVSSIRAIRYFYWCVGSPEYVISEEGMSCRTAFLRHPQVYSWDTLIKVTNIHAHFVFQQGKRVILPNEFLYHCYHCPECTDLLDKAIGGKMSTTILGCYVGKPRYFKSR